MSNQEGHPFIRYLQKLADGQERGALASLRRGLGQRPGTVADMYRYVEPFLGQAQGFRHEGTPFLLSCCLQKGRTGPAAPGPAATMGPFARRRPATA